MLLEIAFLASFVAAGTLVFGALFASLFVSKSPRIRILLILSAIVAFGGAVLVQMIGHGLLLIIAHSVMIVPYGALIRAEHEERGTLIFFLVCHLVVALGLFGLLTLP